MSTCHVAVTSIMCCMASTASADRFDASTCQPSPMTWAAATDVESGAVLQASVKSIGRAVQRMASADLLRELQSPDLLPGLFEAFDHHSADVRKAVTMCLMHMWQVCASFPPSLPVLLLTALFS